MPWHVAHVEAIDDTLLRVRFVDSHEGTVDISRLIHAPDAGVFAALADPAVFRQAFVCLGAVTWPGEIDLAPDAMYREIERAGRWVL